MTRTVELSVTGLNFTESNRRDDNETFNLNRQFEYLEPLMARSVSRAPSESASGGPWRPAQTHWQLAVGARRRRLQVRSSMWQRSTRNFKFTVTVAQVGSATRKLASEAQLPGPVGRALAVPSQHGVTATVTNEPEPEWPGRPCQCRQ
jgi:hypothetical protein